MNRDGKGDAASCRGASSAADAGNENVGNPQLNISASRLNASSYFKYVDILDSGRRLSHLCAITQFA